MAMDLRQIEARIRQLYALDRNAAEIYSSISSLAPDKDAKLALEAIARDEAQHMLYSKKMLELLGCK